MSNHKYINQAVRESAVVSELDGKFYVALNTSYRLHQRVFDDREEANDWARKVNHAVEDSFLRLADTIFSL